MTVDATDNLIKSSLETSAGWEWLKRTHAQLYDDYSRRRFNTARAVEMYTIAIERSVLAKMGDATSVLTMRRDGSAALAARELTEQFKDETGAVDQRRARTGLWAMIVGA